MTDRLVQFLAAMSGRERLLVALLLIIAIPAGLVQGVAMPLLARQDAARLAVAEAEAMQDWLRARQAELAMLPAINNAGPAQEQTPPAGLSALETGLVSAGLREPLVTLTNPSGGSVSLRFQAAPFTRLMPWLEEVEQRMGYRLTMLRLSQTDAPDQVDAEIQLEPRQ
ncbi:MAG: type II secretion system protein M [Pararhodobacter sp.]|nr:type II secretion system protein M [Pararhodobacter sp.]